MAFVQPVHRNGSRNRKPFPDGSHQGVDISPGNGAAHAGENGLRRTAGGVGYYRGTACLGFQIYHGEGFLVGGIYENFRSGVKLGKLPGIICYQSF